MPLRYFNTEHFFEAQRLSAELQVSRRPMLDTRFVFDRTNRAPFDLDRPSARPDSPNISDHSGIDRSTSRPRSRRWRPLSTRRCAREPRTVCALSLHTPSQWMRAHCRGQYTKCSIAEIEMMGASITGVQNRILSSDLAGRGRHLNRFRSLDWSSETCRWQDVLNLGGAERRQKRVRLVRQRGG